MLSEIKLAGKSILIQKNYFKMPISLLKKAVEAHIKNCNFERPIANFEFSPRSTLKNTILNGNGLDIHILDSNRFQIVLQAQRYYEALATDYYYSLQKVQNQRKIIETLLNANSSGAWLLVTVYYQSFYAANEILRLAGYYNSTFDKDAISYLNSNSLTNTQLSSDVSSFRGVVGHFNNGDIEITFQSNGDKPHSQVWQGLSSLLKTADYTPTHKNYKRIERFKKIINFSCKDFPTPSTLRNKWNYSKTDAYDHSQDHKFNNVTKMLSSSDFSNVKSWGERKLKKIDDSTHIESLCYVGNILENALTHFDPKIKLIN